MAKNSITDYSKTAASNTDIQSVDIAEGCLPSGINNAIREIMADLADMNDGTVSLTSPSFAAATITGDLTVDGNGRATFGSVNRYIQNPTGTELRIGADNSSGVITAYTNGSEAIRIDSSGRVGIGTSSPLAILDVKNATNEHIIVSSSSAYGNNGIVGVNDTGGEVGLGLGGDTIEFYTAATERMRIDSSGNLLVGKTSADFGATVGMEMRTNDTLYVARSGGASLALNRTSSDGDIAEFRKDGATVGSIGSRGSGTSYITLKTTSGSGAGLTGSDNRILPMDESALADNNTDLGMSSYRFKDLYLGGTAYVGTSVGIGTTSPSSLLAVSSGSSSAAVHSYTKLEVESSSHTALQLSGSTGGEQWIWFADDSSSTPVGGITYYHGGPYMGFRVEGSERMRIDSSGNVGIGTSSPQAEIHTHRSGSSESAIRFTNGITGSTSSDGFRVGLDINEDGVIWMHENEQILFGTNNSERMRIDSSGNLLVGTTSTSASVAGGRIFSTGRLVTSVDGEGHYFRRNTSDGTIVEFAKDSSSVGRIGTTGGQSYYTGANHGLKFFSLGVQPCNTSGANTDNSMDIGASITRFDDIYATNGTIQTSDQNEKQDIEALSEAEQRVAVAAKGLLRKFRWIDSVEEKGDDARIHFGIIAQDLQAAFEAEGLDAGRYAMFISSTWTDEETGEERSRMGVRYNQLLAFIIAAI